ncbi:cytochrome P450 [Irpex rosettiformis]|uniref:Cytochrome P450 n=1 Tax=Irpex rosettiformis TaxID=378272 RepID=A0ACB8TY94_9APHY|nr:cytochrome P450 [Irpex rosettiformis]
MVLLQPLSELQLRDVIATHVAASLIVHYVFRRWEPSSPILVALLLLATPIPLVSLLLPHVAHWIYAITASYSLFLSTLVLSIISYRLSPFHPLARYPGPLMCRVSKWWMVWETRGGQQHHWYKRMHEQYGDAVRTGPNDISFVDASIIASLMGTTGLPKGPSRSAAGMFPAIKALIMFRDPVEHAHRRKPWNRAFNSAALKEYQPKVAHRASQLVEGLAKRNGVADLSLWVSWFAYDFMGDMASGGGTAMMQNGDGDDLWYLLRTGMVSSFLFEQMNWLPHILKYIPKFRDRVQRMRYMGINRAKARFERGAETKDLFYFLSNEDGSEKEKPPMPVVVSDGALALIAGSDTTMIVLSALFWNILYQPEVYKRLREEVDKFYPSGEDSTSTEHHPQMAYLEAVINETLRMYPPVPSGSQRAPLVGGGDRIIGQYYIPEGTTTRMHIYSLHRDPRNFTDPERYWPERWLIAEGLGEANPNPGSKEGFVHNANAFIPFSFGPANCVGKNLAMQEMRVVVCHVVHELDLAFADGWDPTEFEKAYRDHFVAEVGRLPVVVRQRV